MKNEEIEKELGIIVRNYIVNVENEFKNIWNNWDIDINTKETYEVIGGILARQITIAIQFLSNSNAWTNDIAPIILRSMVDNYINLAWIIEKPKERALEFISYGLGQEKLIIEHRREEIKKQGDNPDKDEMIKHCENWLEFQRIRCFTIVNLGSWSGSSTRKMAEEANCIDFYNFVYTPFSSASHNMWNHISKYNLEISDNPLHKFLFKPFIPETVPSIHYMELAPKYVDKMFDAFYKKYPIENKKESSYYRMKVEIRELSEKFKDKNGCT